jgi:hypothetical protein
VLRWSLQARQVWAGSGMKRFEHRLGLVWAAWLCLGWTFSHAEENPLRWRWSHPEPHGNNIVAMTWSPAAGYAAQVTERGGLYLSVDLERWIRRESGTRSALRAVAFLGSRLVITGESGTVLYADGLGDVTAGERLDGPTDDWLEAVAVSETLAVAVGDNGAVYTSEDGVGWRRRSSGVTDWLRGVAHGGGTFVAVGEGGTILASPDGTRWDRVESGTTNHLNRVAFLNGQFVAVGDKGVIRFSGDGTDWEPRLAGATGNLHGVTGGPEGILVVGESECWVYEGGTWYDQYADPSGGLPPWTFYTAVAGSDWFLAAGRTGVIVEGGRSGSGSYDWVVQSGSPRHWLFDVTCVGDRYVAVGDRASVWTSGTGVDWSLESVPESVTNSVFLGVGGSTNLLVAVGSGGSLMISPEAWLELVLTNQSGTVITQSVSTLGLVWHAVEPRPTTLDLQGVTDYGGQYYVVGEGGLVLRSGDGTNWTQRIAPTTDFLSGITGFEGGLVACGDNGALVYSSDGDHWVEVESGTTNWLYRVRTVNGQLLAVGQNGVMLGSVNGVDWLPRNSGTGRWLNDVTWMDGRHYAVGVGGTVLSSSDGWAWESIGTLTEKALSAAANDGQRLVVVGIEGLILRSPVVPDRTPIEILSYSRVFEPGTGTAENLFLFGGRVDQRFTLDRRPGLGEASWVTGPMLEFTESQGTLYYLETIGVAETPPKEFYRGTLSP